MSQTTIVTLIIFVFAFIPLIIAEFARKSSVASVEDYFLYSRKMPTALAFFTIYSTWYSTFAVIGAGASFYSNGPVYMTCFAWNCLFAVCLYFIGRRIWFYGKTHGYITPTDFFSDIYGSERLSRLVTICMLGFTLPYLAIQMIGGTYLLDIATGGRIPWKFAVLVFYVIMIVYLWAGGIRSVAMTDVFYSVLVFAVMVMAGALLVKEAGGLKHIFDMLMTTDRDALVIAGEDSNTSIIQWLTMFIVTPLGAIMSPPMWIRHYSIKKEKAFSLLPFLITLATVGYIGSVLAGNAARILEPGIENSDMILPSLIVKYGGIIVVAVLFCGYSAAALSTANSQVHALSAIYSIDVHKRYIDRDSSDQKLIYTTKWVILIISMITYIALLIIPSGIINVGLVALSGTMQILVPCLGALFWRKSNANGAYYGLLFGVIVTLVMVFVAEIPYGLCGCIGLLVNAAIFVAVSLCAEVSSDTREKIIKYRIEFERKK